MAYSTRASLTIQDHQDLKQSDNDYEENDCIKQKELQKMKKEFDNQLGIQISRIHLYQNFYLPR